MTSPTPDPTTEAGRAEPPICKSCGWSMDHPFHSEVAVRDTFPGSHPYVPAGRAKPVEVLSEQLRLSIANYQDAKERRCTDSVLVGLADRIIDRLTASPPPDPTAGAMREALEKWLEKLRPWVQHSHSCARLAWLRYQGDRKTQPDCDCGLFAALAHLPAPRDPLTTQQRAAIERLRATRAAGYNDIGGAAIDYFLAIVDSHLPAPDPSGASDG